ncbi:uncharacterized protein LOC128211778 [Mya arenaria]|uniref:uncharacterized protein LOC128211778 n=1 Tax=Mya arenaria TaxID=6604 RepID=UPI0022E93A87|nr:uncharacterized protein LOC128211778 [Mya arenaria]
MAEISTDRLRRKIKDILKGADLSTTSAKKVRLKLQEQLDVDLSDRKKEIEKLTMALTMEMQDEGQESSEEEKNGKGDNSSSSDEEVEKEPPKKKPKTKKSSSKKKKKGGESDDDDEGGDLAPLENDDLNVYDEEQKTLKISDEELAKRLQSFEETGRRTRGRTSTHKPKEKKKREGGGNNTYTRPCNLSADLAALMGTDKLARNEVVKKMWEIVKERKLQDPRDKRFMICDEQLQKIFGRKRVQTFGMMKYLSNHIMSEGTSIESVITNSDIYDDEADDDD